MSAIEQIKQPFAAFVASLALYLAAVVVPVVGSVFLPLTAQPLARLGLRAGNLAALGAIIAASCALYAAGGEALALGYLLIASMALFLLYALAPGRALERVVLLAASGVFALGVATLHALAGSFAALKEIARKTLDENLRLALSVYEKAGVSRESTDFIREQWPGVLEFLLVILPGLAFAASAIAVLLNLLLLIRRFGADKAGVLPGGDPREWKAPEPLVWIFIASGFGALVFEEGWIRAPSLNVLLVSALCYFFQGFAIIAYYFHHKKVPVLLRALGYALIFLEPTVILVVTGLGLFDLWIDFRRLNKKELHPTQAA
ncbi:MAG TPA: DUF2232 domain-containing protein [Candidatus Acidoferrales bacterium]|nr:DUF2232 domain-containing protein [Candidatus Acidoferrales bacterium]